MKRIICFILATIFILSMASCENSNEPTETEAPCVKGHSFTISYTNTCESDGYKISTCSICGFEQKEEAKATGHEFKKNDCVNCDFKATKIEELPLEYRQKLAEEIKLIAPYSSDINTLAAIGDLYIVTQKDYEDAYSYVDELEKTLEYTKNNLTVVEFENGNWTRVPDKKKIEQIEKSLSDARKILKSNEELFYTLKLSIETNAQGAAWEILIEELESETTSNKKIASRLLAVFFAYSYPTGNTNPYWKQDVFDTFKEKTGLEIDMSKALS